MKVSYFEDTDTLGSAGRGQARVKPYARRDKSRRGTGEACPCGSGAARGACCGPYLDGDVAAPTAEALMRSRYSAFIEGRREYLLWTWAEETRPETLNLDPGQRWLGLTIRATSAGGVADEVGEVEFVARSRVGGRGQRLHERSRFRRVNGLWVYVDGTFPGKAPA
jgi:SEC-C motif domain protein